MSFVGSIGQGFGGSASRFMGQTRGRVQGSFQNGVNYPSPFFDVAHTYLPVTVKQLFRWCRYYFLTNPLINATVFKLSEYPVTDLIIEHPESKVRRRWEEYFQDHLRFRAMQVEFGLDYHCLAGETRVITKEGVLPISKLAGHTAQVLSEGGVYRRAEFKSYGHQQLWEVHTDDGVLFATAEHEWITDGVRRKQTKDLKGSSIPRVASAERPKQNADFWEGVRHGIVFGDGTLSNEGRQAHVILHTAEKQELAKYFEGYATITPHHEDKYLGVYGLHPSFKRLPSGALSASYWYGFTCGLLATDGSVNTRGDTVLTQKNPEVLLNIAHRLPWMGLLGGRVREHRAWNSFTKQIEPMNYLTLKKQSLQGQDFVRSDQRKRFTENFEETNYGKFAKVKKVVPSNRFEEVFCCVEPETHSFVIEGGLLTGNCYGNTLVSMGFPFKKYLRCKNCRFSERADKIRQHWTFTTNAFRLDCPQCGQTSEAEATDVYYKNASGINVIRWNCEHVEINYNDATAETTHFYTIPPSVRNDIVIGKKDVVEGVPQVFIQAIRQQKGVVFSKDNLFHMKRATLAQQDRGWGIPLILPVLKDTFYLQIMKKAQEAILLEHIVPLRVLFPQAGSGSSDPYTSINLVDWRDHVASEIARWRYDQNYIPILPLPIGNQTIGGDGRALLLTQEIQTWSEQIMVGMGVPKEFLLGGMSYAGTNVSMRMLENAFIGYILRQKQLANWIMERVSAYMGWPRARVRFKPFKMADDLQRKAYLFQLNGANKISDTSLLADSDLNQEDEDEIMIRETAKRLQATKMQQLAMAQIQGEAQVIMAKYQAKAQQVSAQVMASGAAPGEPGAGIAAPTMPGLPAGQPGSEGAPGIPQASQSDLSAGQNLSEGAPGGVDINQLAEMLAQQYVTLGPSEQQMAMENLQSQSPDLAQLVQQAVTKLQASGAGPQQMGGAVGQAVQGVDTRPLPEQRGPRREAALV
jgi:hypothetical protein